MTITTLDSISPQELSIVEWFRQNNFTNYFSDFIKREDSYGRLVSGVMGWHWEDEFKAICELQGFNCEKTLLGNQYDLLVNGKRVQCKFTLYNKRIDLRGNGHRGKYKATDFDIMALNINMGIYIVPISRLLNTELTEVRSSAKIEDIAQFKDNYEVFHV